MDVVDIGRPGGLPHAASEEQSNVEPNRGGNGARVATAIPRRLRQHSPFILGAINDGGQAYHCEQSRSKERSRDHKVSHYRRTRRSPSPQQGS